MHAFHRSLYEEHFEQAAFLSAQRRRLRDSVDGDWRRVEEVERRLDAHVDALVLGGKIALEIVRSHAEIGSPGGVYALGRVLTESVEASQGLQTVEPVEPAEAIDSPAFDALCEVLTSLDSSSRAILEAAEDAVVDAGPRSEVARMRVTRAFAERGLMSWVARLAGRFRLSAWIPELERFLERAENVPDLLVAFSRLRAPRVAEYIRRALLEGCDEPRVGLVALALAKGPDDPEVQAACQRLALEHASVVDLLPNLGLDRGLSILLRGLDDSRDDFRHASILGLGRLGRPEHLPILLDRLSVALDAEVAARALECMTGFEPIEQAVRDLGDGDSVREARLSTNESDWRDRIAASRLLEAAGRCHRLGRPYERSSGREILTAHPVPTWVRDATIEDLVLEGRDPGFEVRDLVRVQTSCLGGLEASSGWEGS